MVVFEKSCCLGPTTLVHRSVTFAAGVTCFASLYFLLIPSAFQTHPKSIIRMKLNVIAYHSDTVRTFSRPRTRN